MLTMQQILDGLKATGERLDWSSDVEIVLAGAAACLLTGVIGQTLTTVDCDVLDFNPLTVRDAVMRAGKEAASALGLPPTWLNDDVRNIEADLDMLPLGWQKRLYEVGTFGKLRIRALDRFDLLATKLFAGRAKDRDHLIKMRPTKEETARLKEYLRSLEEPYRRTGNRTRIEKAQRILEALEAQTDR
jgi:hypothetical protein